MSINIVNSLSDYWHQLQAREQRVILAGGFLVGIVAVGLLFSYYFQEMSSLNQQQRTLDADFEWMLEQVELDNRIDKACESNSLLSLSGSADGKEQLTRLATAQLLNVVSLEQVNNLNFRLLANTSNGNSVLRFSHQSACMGFEIVNLSIKSIVGNTTSHEAQLELRYLGQGL